MQQSKMLDSKMLFAKTNCLLLTAMAAKESGGGAQGKESGGGGKESAGEDCYVFIQSKF